jgi:putative ABC transport system permease protein
MTEVVAHESAPWRFLVRMFVAFAAVAGGLAAIGLGGVVALSVASRRRELAIRAALGADRTRLRGVVLREGVALAAGGMCLGLVGAVVLGRAVSHLLVGVAASDPMSLAAAAIAAAAITLAASWWPARRAASTDPAEVLRTD